jgi:hypothetical protein
MSILSGIDALAASTMKNNLSPAQLTTAGIKTNYTPPDGVPYNDNLNNILNHTTIKRACCINKGRAGSTITSYPITVRIPKPTGYVYDIKDPRTETWKKYGYIDKTINIPDSVCTSYAPNYSYSSDKCDNFMGLYCKNIWEFYSDEIKTNYALDSVALDADKSKTPYILDAVEFSDYKPECACYIPQPSYITGAVAPTCWAAGCDPNSNQCYQDANSRQKCGVTICTSNYNVNTIDAGRDVSLSSTTIQQCGNQVNPAESATSKTEPPSAPKSDPPSAPKSDPPSESVDKSESTSASKDKSESTSASKDKSESTSASKSEDKPTDNTMTYVMYGVGILILLILLFLCFTFFTKKKKGRARDD